MKSLIDGRISPRYEEISIQEAFIDDQTSEEIANLLEIFRKEGAHDVSCQTIKYEKKEDRFFYSELSYLFDNFEKQEYFRQLWFQLFQHYRIERKKTI